MFRKDQFLGVDRKGSVTYCNTTQQTILNLRPTCVLIVTLKVSHFLNTAFLVSMGTPKRFHLALQYNRAKLLNLTTGHLILTITRYIFRIVVSSCPSKLRKDSIRHSNTTGQKEKSDNDVGLQLILSPKEPQF